MTALPPIRYLTKVRLPQHRPDVLRRTRLVDFLHQEVDKRVIIVCAAAGYGKTTLLVDFAHDADLPVCWYSLEQSDSDPKTFIDYLILSLQQRFPGFGRQTQALLDSLTDVTRDINSIIASLVNEIQSDIPDYFLIVLDDYHTVDNNEVVNSALDLLIYYLPDNCHLVVSTRSLPPISFARLAAQRQVAGIGTGDLRFTSDELGRLLRDNYKLALPAHQADEVITLSEGWVTGILLTTHTLRMGLVESILKARGAGSPLFDYLANEAYLQQPLEVQRFLLSSSVLERMTPDLCDQLFAKGTARDMLSYLVKANLFTEELDGPGEWYRYHNLFQAFLQAKLKAKDRDLYTTVQIGAARLAEADNEWDLALGYYDAAGATRDVAGLVERVGEDMMRSGRWQTLHRWLGSLPSEVIDTRPALGLFFGRTHLWSGELDKAIGYLESAADRYRQIGDVESAGSALTLKSVGLRAKGRFAEALAGCSEALVLQDNRPNCVAAEAHRDTGICLAAQGELEQASVEMQCALLIYEELGDRAGIATLSQAVGLIAVRMGDLARGVASYRRALALWNELSNVPSVAEVLNCIAMVHFYTGEYQQAASILDDALSKACEGGYLRIQSWVLSSIGDVRRDSGELAAALDVYESALDIAQRVDEIPLINYLLDGLANVHRLLGDYATAERLLRQALHQAEENNSHYEAASYWISTGVLAEEQDDLARAEEALARAMGQLSNSGARRDLARARFHLARTAFARGDRDRAVSELESSLELCRQLGYDQFMVAEGQRAGSLLSFARSKGVGGRRLELIVERLGRVTLSPIPQKRPKIRTEAPAPKQIEVYSFGHGRVLVDSRPVTTGDWAVEKTKELFFYLLVQPHSLRKEQIVDTLWPELDPGKSNSQFHSTVYRLRRAISPQCVFYHDGRYELSLGSECTFDSDDFTRLLDEAENAEEDVPRRVQAYESAIALHTGPFLEELYSEWVDPIRERLEERYLRALNSLAWLRVAEGSLEQAMQLLRTALKADPYQEDAHYGLIHVTALLGDRAAALRHYKSYVDLLNDDLDAQPSPRMTLLADRIAAGHSVPPLRLLSN
jgi:LuxR family transcriptional regulator, maltose regulon positive regulatory protein